jgi:hypothetical protein
VVLTEDEERRGDGIYFIRRGPARPVLVEVPHSFFDLQTLPVGRALFDALEARALLVNTVHRYRGAGFEPETVPPEGSPADVAHAPDSAFHAVHEGLIDAVPEAVVLAVHGFAPEPGDPDVIISAAGTEGDARACRDALDAAFEPWSVGLYGADVERLGGKTGAQARHLRERRGRMIHIELSRPVRKHLASHSKGRRAFARALRRCVVATSTHDLPP